MSLIQIQKKKQLTFTEICPRWARDMLNRVEFGYHNNFAMCIVGEAHGFTSEYASVGTSEFCQECLDYSNTFGCCNFGEIDDFVAHWNEHHV